MCALFILRVCLVRKFLLDHNGSSTDVRYVDLARYKDRPARALRELFVGWRDSVAWRAPGIPTLDNLESILGIEAEVRLILLTISLPNYLLGREHP